MNSTLSAKSVPLLKAVGTPGSKLDLDKPVFHYTSAIGAKSILRTKQLWASNARYLNDSSELQLAYDMAFEVASERLNKIPSSDSGHAQPEDYAAGEFLRQIKKSMQCGAYHPNLDVYVTCFCSKDDVLSQWRGYSDGGGFSIGITPRLLKSAVLEVAVSMGSMKKLVDFRRVDYSHKKWRDNVSAAIDSLTEDIKRRVKKQNGIDVMRLTGQLCSAFSKEIARAAPYIKDNGFKEEREVRLSVYTNASVASEAREFRTAGTSIIPHFNLPIEESLTSVRVGPREDYELQVRAIQLMRLKPDVVLAHSRIPFRT